MTSKKRRSVGGHAKPQWIAATSGEAPAKRAATKTDRPILIAREADSTTPDGGATPPGAFASSLQPRQARTPRPNHFPQLNRDAPQKVCFACVGPDGEIVTITGHGIVWRWSHDNTGAWSPEYVGTIPGSFEDIR